MKLKWTGPKFLCLPENKIYTQTIHLLSLPCFFKTLVIRRISFTKFISAAKGERIFYKDVVVHFNQANYPYLNNLFVISSVFKHGNELCNSKCLNLLNHINSHPFLPSV